ncbi:DNA topoisomerase IB [Nonomuraea roseoviolacea]|uniref:DNA topoisomerase IB n=1 Tax=Nonomuraea roseoviolacea subsp. carminata TaxID=160689 RepID=A0ABT1K4Z4_9ACTN|nr:DNA topoisomerase IB [Nonomuraea roseoviolacea]MCP2349080.1 DNA topoisomerase IB [Nonomuraea roseoviolacea subsp. carminata]
MPELHPSDRTEAGITRRRRGRGFSYHHADGAPVDAETLARIKALAIPPAWTDVWICASPHGHLQAVGTDSAGRLQYRYHDLWRQQQDRIKFDRVLELADRLPGFRKAVDEGLRGRGLTRERVLAAAARMLDVGFFRVGGESYDTYGLATLRMEHVACTRGAITCRYPAKGDIQREVAIADSDVCSVIRALKRRHPEGELLRYRQWGRWVDVRSDDINDYLRETIGDDFTAKDFRTWHATVLAAVGLAVSTHAGEGAGGAKRKAPGKSGKAPGKKEKGPGKTARKRAVARVMREVSEYLGNTPTVARESYVDPRVVEAYERGSTIAPVLTELGAEADFGQLATHGAVERAVIDLIRAV